MTDDIYEHEELYIDGSKGKGGGGGYRTPKESPDSLQSTQNVTFIDAISEGPILGLYDGSHSIYLNQTPLQTKSGNFTVDDVSYQVRLGTADQAALSHDAGAESIDASMGCEITHTTPKNSGTDRFSKTFEVSNTLATRIRINLYVNGLYETLTDEGHSGDIVGSEVKYRIVIKNADNQTVRDYTATLSGKTTSQYSWDKTFNLDNNGPWLVTVYKESADSTSSYIQNDLFLASCTSVVGYSFSYPNTALVAMTCSAEAFSGSVPERAYRVKGLKILVPNNYNPDTRKYNGTWDGTFKLAWTDNPAWILYDAITSDRYGLQRYLPEKYTKSGICDKWFLYDIAKWCDELVDDGKGGKEPRYTFNQQIQGAGEAKEVIQSIASVFHGMTYWCSGLVYSKADKPTDTLRTLSQSNVIDGVFTYSTASNAEKHSVAHVTWYDPDDMGRAHVESYYDWDAYKILGYRPISITAYGCYSRGQALRFAKWTLISERDQWACTCRLGLDNFDLLPGDVLKISDSSWMGYRASGRIKGINADKTVVTLDSEFKANDNEVYTLSVVNSDNKDSTAYISRIDGNTVYLSEPLQGTFTDNTVWSISSSGLDDRLFRVQDIKETEEHQIEVVMLQYNPHKFDEIEKGLVFDEKPTRRALTDELTAPDRLNVAESLATVNSKLIAKAVFGWGYSSSNFLASQYQVQTKDPLGRWTTYGWTSDGSLELSDVIAGEWTFRVRAKSYSNKVSPWSTISQELLGADASNPTDVSSITLSEWGYMQLDGTHISNIDVTWTSPIGMKANAIDGFNVYYRYDNQTTWNLYQAYDSTALNCTLENVLTGRTISILIKTKSKFGALSTGSSKSLKIIGKDALPSAPTNFKVVRDIDRSKVKLSWDAVNEIDIYGYRIFVNDTVYNSCVSDTSCTVELSSSGNYKFGVASIDNAKQLSKKVYSAEEFYSVIPEDVQNFTVVQSPYRKTSLIFSWTAEGGADIDYYEIREGRDFYGNSAELIGRANTNTFTLDNYNKYGVKTFGIIAHTVGGYASQFPQYCRITVDLTPTAPTNLTAVQSDSDPTILNISWTSSPDLDITSYELRDGLSWDTATLIGVTASNVMTLNCFTSHEYNLLVRANNSAGYQSDTVSYAVKVMLEPPNVTGFNAIQDGDNVNLWWNQIAGGGVDWYELREGFTWDSSSLVATGITGTEYSTPVSFERSYRYLIKAHTRANYYSSQAAVAQITVVELSPKNILIERKYHELLEDGTGAHYRTQWTDNPCTWQTIGGKWSDYPDKRWADFGSNKVLSLQDGYDEGSWESQVIDLGRVIKCSISFDMQSLNLSSTSSVQLFYRTKDNADDDWTDLYKPFKPHTESFRYIQFRAELIRGTDGTPPYVTLMHTIIDPPDMVKSGRVNVTQTGGTEIDYKYYYCIIPHVVVTCDGATKRAVIDGAPKNSKCTVRIYDNATNTETTGIVNWAAYGY